jgi:hypothetical protein
MTLDLTTIMGGIAGVVILFLSMMAKSARSDKKLAEKERDDAQAEAMSANQRIESMGVIAEINREKEVKDDEIINSPVDRNRPLGVWVDKDSDK